MTTQTLATTHTGPSRSTVPNAPTTGGGNLFTRGCWPDAA